MMMQTEEKNRLLNYTKIDQYEDNECLNNEESYRQIFYFNEHFDVEQEIKIIFYNRWRLICFLFLILTSQSTALPVYQPSLTHLNYNQAGSFVSIQQTPPPLPIAMVQLTDRATNPQQFYRIYRRLPNPIQPQYSPVPSYSNGAAVQIYDQNQFHNQQQLTLQLRRERQRRAMIEKIVTLFDEDGNGQLTKEELYSMALRSNMFPKFHHYLKQTPT